MVVDDEQDVATSIKIGLEAKGFTVDAFTDPALALANFKADAYDMLLTDIKMHDMSGFDLYREVKKLDGKIRVAFITAFEIREDEFRKVFKDFDVTCFIKKPISMSGLANRINQELAKNEITVS
jgi:DNA-binding response OmpR family regulator